MLVEIEVYNRGWAQNCLFVITCHMLFVITCYIINIWTISTFSMTKLNVLRQVVFEILTIL